MMIHSFADGNLCFAEDYFFPEVLDKSGTNINEGIGELIGTSFYNQAMPFIRYRTRDLVEMGANKQERGFRFINQIIGRLDDEIMLPNGGRVSLVEGALGYAEGIVAAQYIQEDKKSLKVVLVVDESFSETYFKNIEEALVKRLGNELDYNFVVTDKLETTSSGKTPFIINKIQG
jgi:phenylacetate-CoA ligase